LIKPHLICEEVLVKIYSEMGRASWDQLDSDTKTELLKARWHTEPGIFLTGDGTLRKESINPMKT
jgi:hypothetical protein